MKSKKAAIELSMTTIIVIVIGVVLLSLGLVWIRSVMNQTGGLTTDAFDQAKGEIGRITLIDKPLTIAPNMMTLEQKDAKKADVTIANFESSPITVKATVTAKGDKLACGFDDTFEKISNSYTLESGDQLTIGLIAEEQGGALGIKGCVVNVDGLSDADKSATLTVRVVKE